MLLCGHKFSGQLDKYLGMVLVDSTVRLCLALLERARLSFKVVLPFCFPPGKSYTIVRLICIPIVDCVDRFRK